MASPSVNQKLHLRVGEWVIVRPAAEILATLDSNARFEELPLMPQMLQHCGIKFRVKKRAHKLCDTVNNTGGRQMSDAVILGDLRCDGQAYGGCELECTIVWKEAWLRRADENEPASPSLPSDRLEALVRAGTRRPSPDPASSEQLYVCQATQLPVATKLLPVWDPRQYAEDYRSGNATLSEIVSRLFMVLYVALAESGLGFGRAMRWIYNTVQSLRGGAPYPMRRGILPLGGPTPSVQLGLQVGELVRVKSLEQILETVDTGLVNRGMGFHPEMIPYCGKTFRIRKRVRVIINEKTGQLKQLKNSCLVLDGADCHGCHTRPLNCPRACPPYWREIWLERADASAESTKVYAQEGAGQGDSIHRIGFRREQDSEGLQAKGEAGDGAERALDGIAGDRGP
jgi:hypothetical protein